MHQQARNNTRMCLVVEQGIAHDLTHGSVAAWRFMTSHGVPEELILRVLSDPGRRRATDIGAAHSYLGAGKGLPPASAGMPLGPA